MKLKDIYSDNSVFISYEVFPPKDDYDNKKTEKMYECLRILKKHNPSFVSLTYGAGGSEADKSYAILEKLINDLKLTVMPHFTCVNATKNNVLSYINDIKKFGIENILALRGDIPDGVIQENFDFKHASDLIMFINNNTPNHFSIGVAGYPEGHIESKNLESDLSFLEQKVKLGADAIFTQLFFDNSRFIEFTDKVGTFSDLPIVAGIMPIISYKQVEKMISLANVSVPNSLKNKLEKFKDNPDDIKKLGIDFATSQCQNLLDNGYKNFHFYTLNLSSATDKILTNLGY